MKLSMFTLAICVVAFFPDAVFADNTLDKRLEMNEHRAVFHYQMHCQGCHTPNGAGGNSVPDLRDNLGHFLKSDKGRKYLVQVPGSSNSVLSNDQLAEVLNWMLLNYANNSLAEDWTPYAGDEIADYRYQALYEVIEYRRQLVSDFANNDRFE